MLTVPVLQVLCWLAARRDPAWSEQPHNVIPGGSIMMITVRRARPAILLVRCAVLPLSGLGSQSNTGFGGQTPRLHCCLERGKSSNTFGLPAASIVPGGRRASSLEMDGESPGGWTWREVKDRGRPARCDPTPLRMTRLCDGDVIGDRGLGALGGRQESSQESRLRTQEWKVPCWTIERSREDSGAEQISGCYSVCERVGPGKTWHRGWVVWSFCFVVSAARAASSVIVDVLVSLGW